MSKGYKQLEECIAAGRGMGVGDRYQPWIVPTKRGTSKSSNRSYVPMPMVARHCYFLSRAEKHFAALCWWLGAEDVREQYPLWPWPHPHPSAEVDSRWRWPPHPGMDAVAVEAGIRTLRADSPEKILSCDLMVTFRQSPEAPPQLIGISCKPQIQYERAKPGDRVRERLELDRLYCEAAGIGHLLAHAELLPPTLLRQIEWLAPLRPRAAIDAITRSCRYQVFVERFSSTAFEIPACIAIQDACRGLDWSPMHSDFAARLALWRLDIEVDLRRPISMASPLPRGNKRYRDKVTTQLAGEAR